MIVRILNEGQWELADDQVDGLNALDDAIEQAVASDDAARLTAALEQLLNQVRSSGKRVPDDELVDSDLILPDSDATLDEVRQLLNESEEGLIPG